MKIIAGKWRGRPLEAPPGLATRPTASRAREALFSVLASRLPTFEGCRVLDLFAGSGALGLEALSRGAAHATFVEQFAPPRAVLGRNLAALGAEAQAIVIAGAVEKLGLPLAPFELVFADPPYHMGLAGAALALLARPGWLAPAAWVMVETAHDEVLPGGVPEADRSHGKARLRLFRAESLATARGFDG